MTKGRPVKWTKKVLLALAEEYKDWLNADPLHLYEEEFFIVNKGLYEGFVANHKSKDQDFKQAMKTAEAITKFKLKQYGMFNLNHINYKMAQFVLDRDYGMIQKTEQKIETNIPLSINYIQPSGSTK
jgi:hypothetical protein